MTRTHTEATLEISPAAFEEIKEKLSKAGYSHLIHGDLGGGWISMTGLRVSAIVDQQMPIKHRSIDVDGADYYPITVNGKEVQVSRLRLTADEMIRSCGPGYSETPYYRVIETLLIPGRLEEAKQNTYSGNMVIDYKPAANYVVLRRDQPLPAHLQLKQTVPAGKPQTQIEIAVAGTIAMLNCPFCDAHSLDLRVRDSGLEISFGIFCSHQTPNKEHYKSYPDGKIKWMTWGEIVNMVIDDLVTPVIKSKE